MGHPISNIGRNKYSPTLSPVARVTLPSTSEVLKGRKKHSPRFS